MATLMAVLLNVALNFVLIWGIGPWSGLGFAGSPLATSITMWVTTLTVLIYCARVRGLLSGALSLYALALALLLNPHTISVVV